MKKVQIDWMDAQEIAEHILKIENKDDNTDAVENALAAKWGIALDTFQDIAQELFNMVDFSISPLNSTDAYVGLSTSNMWLVKKEVNQQFILAIIEWCTEGKEMPEDKKGFVRSITKAGKPEFDITISRAKNKVKNG